MSTTESAPPAQEEVKKEPLNCDVIAKYKAAGEITNSTLRLVQTLAKTGARVYDLCAACDAHIVEETSKIYNKKSKDESGKKFAVPKGVGFPTCISLNHYVGHFSPMDDDKRTINNNDIVKVECGTHIDGHLSVGAVTFRIDADGNATSSFTDEVESNVVMAVHTAKEALLRLCRPGTTSFQMKDVMVKVARAFHVLPILGVCSHTITQHDIDGGNKVVVWRDTQQESEQAPNGHTMEEGDVWVIDIVLSNGRGEPKEVSDKTTVYSRKHFRSREEEIHCFNSFKTVAGREFFASCPRMYPFNLRHLCDEEKNVTESRLRLGIKECFNRQLLAPYPVLCAMPGETIAHTKLVVVVTSNGPIVTCGLPQNPSLLNPTMKLEDKGLLTLLSSSLNLKKNKKKNKKKKDGGGGGEKKE